MPKKSKVHPGFEPTARRIAAHEGIPLHNARAILAMTARHASAHAVEMNPKLLKVKRGKK